MNIRKDSLDADLIQIFLGEGSARLEEVVECMQSTQLLHLTLMVDPLYRDWLSCLHVAAVCQL